MREALRIVVGNQGRKIVGQASAGIMQRLQKLAGKISVSCLFWFSDSMSLPYFGDIIHRFIGFLFHTSCGPLHLPNAI